MKRLPLFAALFVPLLLLAVLLPGDETSHRATAASTAVKDSVCARCHVGHDLTGSAHAVLGRTVPNGSCEACHGSAELHVQDPEENRLLEGVAPEKTAALCLSCHAFGPDHVVDWAASAPARKGQTCSNCHTIHGEAEDRLEYQVDAGGYLGDGACLLCHRPVVDEFESSFHAGVIGQPGGGCEACHGPGKEHALAAVDAPPGGLKMAAEPAADSCLLCHRAIPDRHAREMPVYSEKRPACTVCHDVHVDKADPLWADAGPTPGGKAGDTSCSRCHGLAVDSMKASVHAPLLGTEGCESCHGPAAAHVESGGRARFVTNPLKQSPAEASATCLTCHGDAPDHAKSWNGSTLEKQGLSCLTCHQAHGPAEVQGRPIATEGGAGEKGYVGAQACAICHEAPHPAIAESPHAVLMETGYALGCESCHGPGAEHASSGGNPELIRTMSRNQKGGEGAFCLACHEKQGDGLMQWGGGAHRRAGMDCSSCHSPLTSAAKSGLKEGVELCSSCHKDVRASFNLTSHHPLDRGAVTCSSCHDPHGNTSGFLSLANRRESCSKCHKDKEGPFIYEHEAGRVEGCTECHLPHGSMNRRLLTHKNVRDLCIQCHVTPASHNLAAGSVFRNCLNCHGSIHGSYVDEHFFR